MENTKFRQNSDTKIQTKKFRQNSRQKFKKKIRQNFQTKKSDHNSEQNSDQNSDQHSDKKSDKASDKIQMQITVKSDISQTGCRGLGILGCSGSFQRVLFILKMQLQKGFCCFQKTPTISSPLFFEDPRFF